MTTDEPDRAAEPGAGPTSTYPDWAPPGGTTNRRYQELRDELRTAFVTALAARLAGHERLWFKHLGWEQAYAGWRDDPRGAYYVISGLEHQHRLPEEEQRSFVYLTYTRTAADETAPNERRESDIGLHYFDPPYARDLTLHVDHILAWLDAHRRTLDLD